jgi:hypothetical protein
MDAGNTVHPRCTHGAGGHSDLMVKHDASVGDVLGDIASSIIALMIMVMFVAMIMTPAVLLIARIIS